MYLCLFVTFRVTSRKRRWRKHGYEYEALGQGSGDQILLSAILYRFGLVHERPHSSGDNDKNRSENTNINGKAHLSPGE